MDMTGILKAVKQGQQHFACAGHDISDLSAFQTLVAQINQAEKLGLLAVVDQRRESHTGQRLISAVSVGALTDAGETFIGQS